MKFIFVLILTIPFGIAYATSSPSFQGHLTNFTSVPTSDIKIKVAIHCTNRVWSSSCGSTEKIINVESTGRYTVPALRFFKRIGTYHSFSYTLLYKDFDYTTSIICPEDTQDVEKCNVEAFINKLSEISYIQLPNFQMNPVLADGRDFKWFLLNRMGFQFLPFYMRLVDGDRRVDLASVNIAQNSSIPFNVSPKAFVLSGFDASTDKVKIELDFFNVGVGPLSKTIIPVDLNQSLPTSLRSPLLTPDLKDFYLHGDFKLRFTGRQHLSGHLMYFYEGSFTCHEGILKGTFRPTQASDSASRPHPYPNQLLTISGTCGENVAELEFEHGGEKMNVSIQNLINWSFKIFSSSNTTPLGDLTIFRNK